MDNVNVYLAVAIGLVLAAFVGSVKAFGFEVERPRNKRTRLLLLVFGVAFGIAAYIAPLPGTAKYDQEQERKAYQQQVLATCASLKATKHSGDNAARRDSAGNLLRDPLVIVMEGQLSANEVAFNSLWSLEVPDGMAAQQASARAVANAVMDGGRRARDLILTLPGAVTQADLDSIMLQLPESSKLTAELGSVMNQLAGQTCDMT